LKTLKLFSLPFRPAFSSTLRILRLKACYLYPNVQDLCTSLPCLTELEELVLVDRYPEFVLHRGGFPIVLPKLRLLALSPAYDLTDAGFLRELDCPQLRVLNLANYSRWTGTDMSEIGGGVNCPNILHAVQAHRWNLHTLDLHGIYGAEEAVWRLFPIPRPGIRRLALNKTLYNILQEAQGDGAALFPSSLDEVAVEVSWEDKISLKRFGTRKDYYTLWPGLEAACISGSDGSEDSSVRVSSGPAAPAWPNGFEAMSKGAKDTGWSRRAVYVYAREFGTESRARRCDEPRQANGWFKSGTLRIRCGVLYLGRPDWLRL